MWNVIMEFMLKVGEDAILDDEDVTVAWKSVTSNVVYDKPYPKGYEGCHG